MFLEQQISILDGSYNTEVMLKISFDHSNKFYFKKTFKYKTDIEIVSSQYKFFYCILIK